MALTATSFIGTPIKGTNSNYLNNQLNNISAQSLQTKMASLPSYEGGEDENRGGLRGGVGYLGEKLAVGAAYGKTDERKWFQKGAFEDGYQFGDVIRTISASSEDLVNNATAGILGMGEKAVDTVAYLVGLFGNDKFKGKMSDFIAKDLYDEETLAKKLSLSTSPFYAFMKNLRGIDGEEHSVFGEKTDAVAQSGGQLLGQLALQSVGVPWFVTSAVTSFGSEVEGAFNEGATYGEAGVSGLITAGAEILTEKISGGIKFGKMGTLDDGLTKILARGISNKFVRTAAKLGMDVLGEGTEELLSESISRFGQWLTYQDEKTLSDMLISEEAVDAYIEAFIGGNLLGGVGSTTQAVGSKINGIDVTSGLTANEEAVFKKFFDERVAEEAKNNVKKLTLGEKNKIHDEILNKLDRGGFSIGEIAEVLGGETYKAYQEAVNKKSPDSDQLKKQLINEVFNMVKDEKTGRLAESFYDEAREGQSLNFDDTKYQGSKNQDAVNKTIENARKAGLNNTNRTRDLFDLAVKASADKGLVFDFADNETLKATVEKQLNDRIEQLANIPTPQRTEAQSQELKNLSEKLTKVQSGKITVDGNITNNGITLNLDSERALNTIVGHEVTHSLEGTEHYKKLQDTIFEYAKTKKEYQSRLNALKERYKGIETTDEAILEELTSDLVGDYLFNDYNFVLNLATNHRNVFQKIFDEIKYLCKIATAGSKEARELEKVKHNFEKAYQETSDVTEARKNAFSIDEKGEKWYNKTSRNTTKEGVNNGREETNRDKNLYSRGQDKEELLGNDNRWRSISFSDVHGRTRRISEVLIGEEKREKITSLAEDVYQRPKTETQDILLWHAKKEDINLFFVKWNSKELNEWIAENNNLFIPENATEANFVDILDTIKPIERNVDENKIAHISEERRDKFLSLFPDAYITRIPIQQFLDMTTESNVDQRQIYSASSKISQTVPVENIKNTSGEYMYLKVDVKNGEVISHEGRHRMTALLNAGNAYADIFVISDNARDESYKNLVVKGQFNEKRHTISLVKAKSERFAEAIDNMFWRDDGNIRYALSDSAIDNDGDKGYNYTKEQYEQFGWAREADALTKTELDDLYSKIQARYTLRTFKRSSKGEAIVKVNNEPHTKLGVNNVFVFVKGTKNNFKISRVVRFDAQTEVEMEIYEEAIYERGTWSDSYLPYFEQEGFAEEYRRENFKSFEQYQQEARRRSSGQESRGADKDNRGPEEHGSGHSQAFGENGETNVRYALSDDDGGVHNHNKGSDKNGEEADQGRTKSANNGSYKEKSRENSNRSRIQKRMGEAQGAVRENSSAERQHRGLKNTEWLYNENNYIVPDESSELYKAQDTIKNLYGVECYVVKNSAWNRKNPACAGFGKIYICENVDKYTLRTVVAHETTHVMKQQRFKPYLEFISHTIDMLNMSSKECDKLFALISNHINVDVFNMSDEQVIRFYDELNAVVYGFENGQIFDNPNFDFNWIKDAFYDFDAYINELSKIHEQFKSRLTNNKIKETRNFEDYSNLDSVLSLDFDSASGMVHTVTKKTAKETIADGAAAMKNGVIPAVIATQIQFTNQQAGIEYAGKKMGVKDIEKWTNNVRASRAQAQEMLGGKICTVRDGKIIDEGDGLGEILNPIKAKGEDYEHAFYASCYHAHNIDRMLLEKRSIERNEQNKQKLKDMQDKLNELKHDINTNNALLEKLKDSDNVNSRIETTRIREKLKSLKAEHNALNKATKKLKKTIDEFVPEANKPVLAKEINGEKVALTAEESQAILEEYDKRYPEFKQHRQKLYGYNDALMRKRVDAGLITEELYIQLKEKYPHYVPTFREQTEQGTSGISGKYNLAVKKTIGKARGSLADLMPLDKAIARMTEQTVTACNINKLVNVLVDASEAKGDTRYLEEVKRGKISLDESTSKDGDDTEQDIPKTNQISAYRNGEKITYSVTPEVFAGFDAFNSKIDTASLPIKTLQWSTSVFKKLVTSLNPFFSVRNSTRDIQEAGVNTKYPKVFLKNYARAIDLIRTNSKLFQLYRAFGGLNNTVFDYEKGFTGIQNKYGFAKPDNKILSMLTAMERVNMFIEQIPRFAEFISSIEAGSSPEQAVLDAADVTTNFGRTGKITKALNSTIIPFLNPSIQGLSKITRNIRDAFTSAEAFGTFAIKLAIVGVIPQIVNYLFFKDDDDYEKLRDTDKENNYLFKVGDTFIKIPKGRVASVLAGLTNRTTQELEGKNADWKDYFDNVISQITPVENFTRPIWQPVIDATNNKTWYGTKIEGQQFENTRPEDRYDESTSSIAIAMGKITKTSPKKWHYVIDQYSGIIGDILLPMTTPKAENDLIKGNFVLDPTTSNKLSTNFYKLYEEAQYKKTDGDIAAKYQVKYLNKVKKSINELYDQKAKIHQSDDLNNSEKLQQARIIQALINTLYQDVMDNYDSYTKAIAMTQGYYDEETEEDIRQAEITRIVYGSKQALKEYNEKVYEKCELLNLAGVDYDKLYYYYFSTKSLTSDTDKKGNVISGSKKKKVIAAVNALGVSREQKLLLIASKGYSLTDSEKKRLLSYILKLKTTKEKRIELAELCGFTVKNGKIVANFK